MLEKSVEGKSFILIIPNDFKIYEIFNDNLEKFGFDLISIVPKKFRYKSKKQRIYNFFHKTLTQNKSFKKALVKQFHSDCIEAKIKHLKDKSVDYILVIRPDTVDIETLQRLIKIGKKVVAYQWDGLDRFPQVLQYIDLFESFLIFDEADYDKYKSKFSNLHKSENFYFDYDDAPNQPDSNTVYYIGAYYENRMEELNKILDEIEKYPVELDINLRNPSSKCPTTKKYIKFFRNYVDFKTNLAWMKKAKILLDFKVEEHNGLSLRFFEALRYQKKIITNNKTVMEYDFYDPQNVFIINHDDMSRLGEFISTPYKEISKEIVDQYSFSSLLSKYVL